MDGDSAVVTMLKYAGVATSQNGMTLSKTLSVQMGPYKDTPWNRDIVTLHKGNPRVGATKPSFAEIKSILQ